MKLNMKPVKLATVYSASSLIIGPLIFIVGSGFTRGGGDYCDSVYDLPGGSVDSSRINEFHNAQVFQVTGSSVMLAIGLAVIVYLLLNINKKQYTFKLWTVLLVLLAMLGYIFVILISGVGVQNC